MAPVKLEWELVLIGGAFDGEPDLYLGSGDPPDFIDVGICRDGDCNMSCPPRSRPHTAFWLPEERTPGDALRYRKAGTRQDGPRFISGGAAIVMGRARYVFGAVELPNGLRAKELAGA